jgi:hypothetical protein
MLLLPQLSYFSPSPFLSTLLLLSLPAKPWRDSSQ